MVLMYHNIAAAAGFYTVATSAFQQQMQYLSAHFEVVEISAYVQTVLQEGRNRPKQVAVTFDDAYESYTELALPVMQQYHIPSALFVSTDYLGRSNEWDKPNHRFPIMTAEKLQSISKERSITIGAHSKSHSSLGKISEEACAAELAGSKTFLQQLLGKPVDYFSYPFGQPNIDVNKTVVAAVRAAGYKAAFSTNYGVHNSAKDCFALHRVEVEPSDDIAAFKARFSAWQPRILKQKIKNVYHSLKGS